MNDQVISTTRLFPAIAVASLADQEKVGVFRQIKFTCRFELQSNEPTSHDEQDRIVREQGLFGVLDKRLKSVEFENKSLSFVDGNGEPLDPLEFVKQDAVFGAAANIAYWNVVNKDVEAKNSKKPR
jgi:hypothetical protein